MELKDLRAFLTVAETLHFGRAAERLSITPPPLSRQIKRIERELGTRLFHRTNRRVALTPAGEALINEATQVLCRVDGLPGMVDRAARGETGVIRLGVISTALFSQARRLNSEMRQTVPEVRIEWHVMSSSEQVAAIRAARVDLGFVHSPIEHQGLEVRCVNREPLIVALPSDHRLAGKSSIPLKALKDEIFIVGTRDRVPSYYDRFIQYCHEAGFEPKLAHQRQTMISFLGLVAIGAGVAVLPASVSALLVEGVSYSALSGSAPYSEVSIAWNPANESPVLSRTLALLLSPRQQ